MRKAFSRFFEYFINGTYKFGKLFFSFTSLYSLNKEAAVKQTQDFKQLRNEKKILEKEFKKTQVIGHSSAACVQLFSLACLCPLSARGSPSCRVRGPQRRGGREGRSWAAPVHPVLNSCPPVSTVNPASVLFSQERLDEFSKQRNERGEYSVNAYLKMLF